MIINYKNLLVVGIICLSWLHTKQMVQVPLFSMMCIVIAIVKELKNTVTEIYQTVIEFNELYYTPPVEPINININKIKLHLELNALQSHADPLSESSHVVLKVKSPNLVDGMFMKSLSNLEIAHLQKRPPYQFYKIDSLEVNADSHINGPYILSKLNLSDDDVIDKISHIITINNHIYVSNSNHILKIHRDYKAYFLSNYGNRKRGAPQNLQDPSKIIRISYGRDVSNKR